MKVAVRSTFACSKPKRHVLICTILFSWQIATVTIPFPMFRKSLGNMFLTDRKFVRNTVREFCN